jgi:hypothetical protein
MMGLHRPDESFGLVEIEELSCNFCDRPPTALTLWVREGRPGAVWACEEHTQNLSGSGERVWVIRRTCQAVDDDVPCGAAAHWLEIVSTEGKVQPGSLCRKHAEPRLA